ncbi:MAG: dodecin domain-containing protein [Candidatus Heimdallarchaeota archaeon]|nr:dodecin domain-containing protein [Candidatus Heimdallarchaeota archaeon]
MVVKIIEVIGTSEKSWEDAAKNAVEEASKSIRGITGVDIVNQTASVKDGKIVKYKACCKLAFSVED